jgi:taspase (threonine aspartase 1)
MIMVDDSSNTTPDPHQEYIDPIGPPGFHIGNRSPILFANDARKISTASANMLASNRNSNGGFLDDDLFEPDLQLGIVGEPDTTPLSNLSNQSHRTLWNDGSSGSDSTTINVSVSRDANGPRDIERGGLHNATLFLLQKTPDETMGSPTPRASTPLSHVKDSPQLPPDLRRTNNGWVDDEDRITDTVGAIAIDLYGNIACAASSGGIGMKHRGRIGPAALVSVGAAVQPEDPGDAERTTVATVTSGTGEHMSTTTAAGVCSERVFHSVRKVSGGMYEQCLEEESIRGFIEKDFMGHPSVLQSHSAGAIGVLSVKKTKDGAYLYYGHNTDSFAMASMHSNENTPVCTMSRSRGSGQVAQGGRSIRSRKRKL